MTIDEAIESIETVKRLDCHVKYPEWQDALQLGIEALRTIKNARQAGRRISPSLLSGETT